MINNEYVSEEKIKDILSYIKGMKHSEMLRLLFIASLNGLRSINFRYLQVKDVYNQDGSVKDSIVLDSSKNKGRYKCRYFINKQFKKELEIYYSYLQSKYGDKLEENTYLFTSQKLNKPFNRTSICRIFHTIYKKFGINGSSHLGRHLFISRLINNGINPFVVKELVNHRNIQTTNRYYIHDQQQLLNAVESVKF